MTRVLALMPVYLPYPGGAEKSMHEMLRRLIEQGFAVEVLVPVTSALAPQSCRMEQVDGVVIRHLEVEDWFDRVDIGLREAHIIFFSLAHVFRSLFALKVDRILDRYREKVVYFVRGMAQWDYFPGGFVVANSAAVMERIPDRIGVRKLLLKPVITCPRQHPASIRRFVTIVNPTDFKGGELFVELARRMPDVLFLAQLGRSRPVAGLWERQNIVVREPARDLDVVYAETKILLAPSNWEPFGRVAVEGAQAGCLLLLHRAGGLQEVPVPAFCFVDELVPDVWQRRVRALLDAPPPIVAAMRDEIRQRAETYDPGWTGFLEQINALASTMDDV